MLKELFQFNNELDTCETYKLLLKSENDQQKFQFYNSLDIENNHIGDQIIDNMNVQDKKSITFAFVKKDN